MKFIHFKNFSMMLAAVAALGLIGCGANQQLSNNTPPNNPTQPPPPSSSPNKYEEPIGNYRFFAPKSEKELRETLNSEGNAIANYGYVIAKTKPSFKDSQWEKLGFEVLSYFTAGGAKYYYLHKADDVFASMNEAKKNVGVMFIESDIMSYTTQTPKPWEASGWDGNYNNPDPLIAGRRVPNIWAVFAPEAWKAFGFGATKPYVVNVDSGVNFAHQDLTNVVSHAWSWYATGTNPGLLTGATSGTPASHPAPVDRKNVTPIAGNNTDQGTGSGHGTHTVGIMAAQGNNGVDLAGICWQVNLMSYKAMHGGTGSNWPIYGSIWHLAQWKKANEYPYTIPVNMSLGSSMASQFALDMIQWGLANDIMVVGSSGNDGLNIAKFPAAYQGVLTVGATNDRDMRVPFSSYGRHVSVVAPGDWVLSTSTSSTATQVTTGGTYNSGTSMSTPHVTGLIGYILTHNPNLKPDQIKTYIEQNADFIEGKTGFSEEHGWGRINVYKTIQAVVNDKTNGTTPPSNYVHSPVKIIAPANDTTVHLYNCNQAGTTLNYVAGAIAGPTYMGWEFEGTPTTEQRVAWFNVLKPGYYVAKAFRNDLAWTTAVFEVKHGATVPPQTMTDEEPGDDPGDPGDPATPWGTLTIQTIPTQDLKTSGDDSDTVIRVYAGETGGYMEEYDYLTYDTLEIPLNKGTYWIRISDYWGNMYPGEYALYMTGGAPYDSGELSPIPSWLIGTGDEWVFDGICIAPGSYSSVAGPGAIQSTHKQTRPDAQAVNLDSLIYGVFNKAPGTSGATGHFYKIVLD